MFAICTECLYGTDRMRSSGVTKKKDANCLEELGVGGEKTYTIALCCGRNYNRANAQCATETQRKEDRTSWANSSLAVHVLGTAESPVVSPRMLSSRSWMRPYTRLAQGSDAKCSEAANSQYWSWQDSYNSILKTFIPLKSSWVSLSRLQRFWILHLFTEHLLCSRHGTGCFYCIITFKS